LRNGKKFTFLGDEPYRENEYEYAYQADWLLHETFCLYGQRDIFKPYEKSHTTVKDACELAQKLQAVNLILYHTEDKNIENRKKLYREEGQQFFSGNLNIPDDLEKIVL
jgi:ribonuclease Z